MAEPVKYTFDQAFDGGAKSRYDVELERVREESNQAKQQMLEQGLQEGRQQALAEIEASTQEVVTQLAQSAQDLFSQEEALRTELKQEMVQLAYAIAGKLAPALMRAQPLAEVEALIEDCLVTAHKEPHLVVRVADSMAGPIGERLEALKASTGFKGDIVLIGEESLGLQDTRIEWPDGGTERTYSDIQREIEGAVHRYLMSDSEDKPSTHAHSEQHSEGAHEEMPEKANET